LSAIGGEGKRDIGGAREIEETEEKEEGSMMFRHPDEGRIQNI
jgi:hypothetical protein